MIRLYSDDIGPDGCLALTKANWTKISSMNLGNNILTRGIIKSEIKDAIIWSRQTGI